MVNHELQLDHVFSALGNGTRRRILARLHEADDQSVSDLAAPLGMKLPAMLKQLGVLEGASLITRQKTGRTMRVRLAAQPMAEATAWLQRYERFWSTRLDRLAVIAEAIERSKQGDDHMTRVTMVRLIAASLETVFDAITTPEGIAQWWGPDDGPVLSAAFDARVGGRFAVCFRMLDGTLHECGGEVLELVRPLRLVLSWRWAGDEAEGESRVEIALRAVGDRCELVFTHARLPDDGETAASHEKGWNGSLDKLERHLATAKKTRRR